MPQMCEIRSERGGCITCDVSGNNIRTACILAGAILTLPSVAFPQTFNPEIPRVWDDKEVARFELPLAQRERSPRYMTAAEYYALKVRPIYRSYPAYAPGREPAGYREYLKEKEPEILFDPSKLHTKEEWIQAGKVVFETDTLFSPAPAGSPFDEELLLPVLKEGILPPFQPGYRYYVRKKGVLEVGRNSCVSCHIRVLPDGSLVEGAQGNPDAKRARVRAVRQSSPEEIRERAERSWILFGAPWITSKETFLRQFTKEYALQVEEARRPSVRPRQGTSQTHAPHIPSLIGIEGLKFLDATGLVRHRSIADLMRYAVTNEGLDTMAYFGDFQPSPHATSLSAEEGTRYSDEQLYALALYLYSIKPPPNPHQPDAVTRRGERIFHQQGCANCHTPPLYTNNKLTPAIGFKVPDDLLESGDVLNVSVGTDPTLALQTRRGTGFYKVPSLRGVWYRNAFGHGGWAETLEEWLDPARLQREYVPRGYHLGPGPIKGHEFGLQLSQEDRQAMLAFLRTL